MVRRPPRSTRPATRFPSTTPSRSISWGSFFYAVTVLALPMEVELGWSRPAIMRAISLALIVAGLSAPLVGSAIDRGHGRRIMTFGSLLGAAMLLLWSASSAKPAPYAAWVGLGEIGRAHV